MAWFTRSSRFTMLVLTVALILGLAVKVPAQVLTQSGSSSLGSELVRAFSPPVAPGADLPDSREGGATRGQCIAGAKHLTALVPVSGIGQTLEEHPTIYWYMPKISSGEEQAPALEFTLRDAKNQKVYSAQYPLTKSAEGMVATPGLMSLRIDQSYPIKIGQEYRWELRLMCDYTGSDRSDDEVVTGGFKRVEADPNLALRLQQAIPQERVAIYATAQLWYEMLGTLIELRRDRPNDQNLADAWDKLFNTVHLDKIAKEPLVQGVRNIN
jgi:hypothetical protein